MRLCSVSKNGILTVLFSLKTFHCLLSRTWTSAEPLVMAIQGSPSAAYPLPVTLCWLNATLRNSLDSFSAASNTVQCSHFRLWVTLSFCLMPSLPILESPVTTDLAHSAAVPELLMPSARSNLSLSLLGLLAPFFCLSNNWHCVSQASVSCRIYFSSSWECKWFRESNYFRSMYLFITAYLWCVCVHAGTCIPPCTCGGQKAIFRSHLSPSTSLRQGSSLSLSPISP